MNFVGGDESTEKFPPEDTSKSASNSPVSDLPVSDFSVSNFSRTGETGRKGKADDTPVSGFPTATGAANRLSVFQDFWGKSLVNQKSASLALWVARNLHINTADIHSWSPSPKPGSRTDDSSDDNPSDRWTICVR